MKKIELETAIDEMDEESLRASFSDVMEAHSSNISEYDDLKSQVESLSEELEAAKADVEVAKAAFAEKASVYTRLPVDVLVERFSMDELAEFAGQAESEEVAPEGQFSEEEAVEVDGDDDDEEGAKFSEKPSKPSVPEGDDHSQFSEEAKKRLARVTGVYLG